MPSPGTKNLHTNSYRMKPSTLLLMSTLLASGCAHHRGDRIFSDFEPRFLKKNIQTGLLLRVLAPWNLIRLASPAFSRSDLAAEYYDHLLFSGATFGDLTRRQDR